MSNPELNQNPDQQISIREFRDISEISPFPILIHKMGIIRYANSLCMEMFETDNLEEIHGRNILEYVVPEDRQIVIDAIQKGATQKVRNTIVSARMVTRKGNVMNVETKSVNINYEGEECRLIVAYNYDHYSKVEAELHDKKILLEKIAQLIPDSLIVVDNHSREVLFENKPLLDVLGYTKEDLKNEDQFKLFARIIHPEDLDKLVEARKFLYAPENEGKFISTEYRVKAKDGSWHWILSRSTLFKRLDGKGHQINFGIAQDITTLKNIEQELLKQKNFSDKVTTTVPAHISIFNVQNYTTEYANTPFWLVLGYDKEPESVFSYFHPDSAKIVEENFKNIENLKEGDMVSRILMYLTKDGEIKHMLSRYTPFAFDEKGQVKSILSTVVDVTDLVNTELKLQNAEQERKAILLALPDILFHVHVNGTILNVYAGEIYRKKVDSLNMVGKTSDKFLPSATNDEFLRKLQIVIDSNQTQTLQYIHNEGNQKLHYEFRISKLNDNSVVLTARDISTLITTQQELDSKLNELSEKNRDLEKYITSNTELERFAYIASHDLREPIRSIIGFSQLLHKKIQHQSDPETEEFFQNIINSAQRMNSLVHGLLDYSRVTSNVKQFNPCDLNILMDKVLSDIKATIEEKNAKVIVGQLPVVKCDELQIRQLFQNLISNGIKFHKDNVAPVIEIFSEKKDDHWLFRVTDNGIGIDMKYSDKVFQIFTRLHGNGKYQGSGIGLTVCKKIIERHGGELWLHSELNNGTTFFFTLPATD